MRRLLVLLGLCAWSSAAFAGEFELPTLRGTQSFVPPPATAARWGGLYAGGQIGFNNTAVDATTANAPLVAHMLRVLTLENEQLVSTWPVLGKGEARAMSYGAFLGYNVAWEGVILGIEGSWNRLDAKVVAPSTPLTRAVSAGCCNYVVTSDANAIMTVNGYGTIKARAGWDAGNFLPYGAIGLAYGQLSYLRSATVSGTQTNPSDGSVVPFIFSETEAKGNAWIYGLTFSAGVDLLVMPNMFVRAEYEYVAFARIADFKTTINTGRLAVGLKF
jgi:outer membrane immunogenic protein